MREFCRVKDRVYVLIYIIHCLEIRYVLNNMAVVKNTFPRISKVIFNLITTKN